MRIPGILAVLFIALDCCPAGPAPVVLETDTFRYVIDSGGRNLHFIDKQSGADYAMGSPFARLRREGKNHDLSSLRREGSSLRLQFAGTEAGATLKFTCHPRHLELQVESVRGDPESLVFLNLPLRLRGKPGESFGACALSLNLFTRVHQLPALQTHLEASCYRRFGITGASVAIIGVPQEEILSVLKDVIQQARDLPKTTASGPWAREIPFNRGSYLFNFGSLTEENVGDWIAMTKRLGFNQIDSHGGGSRFFRFGDFHLNEKKWPRGWDNYRNIVQRLHDEKIGAIFHTYCFFIDKQSKYVTPVPHRDLDAFRTFTLREPITPEQEEIPVVEPTGDVSTITGFFIRNSVILHLGDELITFRGATRDPPYRFTGCRRGALGTRAGAHPRGTRARHLKECFGLLVPNPESDLFEEIARNHAEVINHCDFDGLYLDAIDGSDILRGGENSWYYASKFLHAIWKHLKRPIGMEMSAMWHHFWQFRSRWQAWDYPNRGHKRFIDIHARSIDGGLLLPLHLGWWNFQTFSPPQVEPSFPDVIEYLGCKLIGHDAGISLTGAVDRSNLQNTPAFQRLVDTLRQYEELRRQQYVPGSIQARLREPGREFTLFRDGDGKWRFRPVRYHRHKISGVENWSSIWETRNEFSSQPLHLRLEVLMSSGPYDAPGNVTLADSSGAADLRVLRTASGVTGEIQAGRGEVDGRPPAISFTARSSGQARRKGSWIQSLRKFDPPLDLGKHQALGVWIHGDGQGELIGFRLESPRHIAHGAIADRYVPVDFQGWRYLDLIETESERHSDYEWPEGPALYHVYRELVNFSRIESLGIWYQNLPPRKECRTFLTPLQALPLVPNTIRNPRITLAGKTITFPLEMRSGDYLEFYSRTDCKHYGPRGKLLGEISPREEVPRLERGSNTLTFTCGQSTPRPPRVQVTVITFGDPL